MRPNTKGEGGVAGSKPMSTGVDVHVERNPNKLRRSNFIFNSSAITLSNSRVVVLLLRMILPIITYIWLCSRKQINKFLFLYFSVRDPDPNQDPDPPDSHVFGPPGSRSTSQGYGSGSGSFYHQAKIVK